MKTWLGGRTLEEWFGGLMMTIVVILLGWQVVLRYAFGDTLSWLEEVARFAFVWAVYFGFIIAAEKDRHIRVSLHILMMPPLAQKIILTLADLVWLIFNSLVIWHGSKFMASMFQFPYISQTTGINLVWVQMIVPLGFALMSLRIVQVMVRRWKTHEPIVVDSRVDD